MRLKTRAHVKFIVSSLAALMAGVVVVPSGSAHAVVDASVTADNVTITGQGGVHWTNQFGTPFDDFAEAVAVDAQAGVYVGGSTLGVVQPTTGEGTVGLFTDFFCFFCPDTYKPQTGGGNGDPFVRRHDLATGTNQWSNQFGSAAADTVRAATATGSTFSFGNQVFVVGEVGGDGYVSRVNGFQGTGDWYRRFRANAPDGTLTTARGVAVQGSSVFVAGSSGDEAYVARWSTGGSAVWTTRFGSADPDVANAVAADSSGNLYVAGAFGGDAFLAKFDSAGNEVWRKVIATGGLDEGRAVTVGADGGVYVAGYAGGSLSGQPYADGADAFVRKYDAAGVELWTHEFGVGGDDAVNGITPVGNSVAVVGSTEGVLSGETSAGLADAFLRTYGPTGSIERTIQFGTSEDDVAAAVASDSVGALYVVGTTRDSLTLDENLGGADAFIRKFDVERASVVDDALETLLEQTEPLIDGLQDTIDETTGTIVDLLEEAETLIGTAGEALEDQADELRTQVGARIAEISTIVDETIDQLEEEIEPAAPVLAEVQTQLQSLLGQVVAAADQLQGEVSGAVDQLQSAAATAFATAKTLLGDLGDRVQELRDDLDAAPERILQVLVRVAAPATWQRQHGGNDNDLTEGIAADAEGNVYSVGTTSVVPSSRALEVEVRKYDRAGVEQWSTTFGSVITDTGRAIALDGAGGLYVAGSIGGDAFVSRFLADGTQLWTRWFPDVAFDEVRGLAVAPDGSVVLVGLEDFNPNQPAASGDVMVRKVTANGFEVWHRSFGTPGPDSGESVNVDANGNIHVAGFTSGALPGQAQSGGVDAFLRTYDASGSEVRTRQFGTPGDDVARAVTTYGGTIYVGGYASGALPGQSPAGGIDAYVRTYDLSGAEGWTRQFGSAGTDAVNALTPDPLGGVAVAGVFGGGSSADAFARRYTADGSAAWTQFLGTANRDVARTITIGGDHVYLGGLTGGIFADVSRPGIGEDAFVAKLFVDRDGDCLSDYEEASTYGTDPTDSDSNDDDLGDGIDATAADTAALAGTPAHRLVCSARRAPQT